MARPVNCEPNGDVGLELWAGMYELGFADVQSLDKGCSAEDSNAIAMVEPVCARPLVAIIPWCSGPNQMLTILIYETTAFASQAGKG